MDSAFGSLLARMQELRDLAGVIGLATWDQETYLPAKATDARASQLSTLHGLYHERLVDPRIGEMLDRADENSALSADQRAMVRVLRRERHRAMGVPESLVRALATAQSHALSAWRDAREGSGFRTFQPALEKLLQLRSQQADCIGYQGERYDALLDAYEPDMTVARLSPVLDALKAKLVPMVRKLTHAAFNAGTSPLSGKTFPVETQWRFTMRLLRDMGFDLNAGRQDQSIHPFTGGTHPRDVRLTTRLDEHNLFPALFGTIHEGGHGLYEQGFSEEHYRTPLAAAPSMGLHESQSRLWENLVGHSRTFWNFYFPILREQFPSPLADVSADMFYAAVNRVAASLIRVDADEVTYNLHIVLRYELELQLLRGQLPVEDLPAEWNRRSHDLLGIIPPDDKRGVLQDIHWAWGEFGYFPTYALGNLYSASLFRVAKRDLPDLEEQIGAGQLLPLRDWLCAKIHAHGYRDSAETVVRRLTGEGVNDHDFVEYLKSKYSSLYQVSL